MEFTEKEYDFLSKHFSDLKEENPNMRGFFGDHVKVIEYAKLNKKPELLYYCFYYYFDSIDNLFSEGKKESAGFLSST